jgi:hypothetical protein
VPMERHLFFFFLLSRKKILTKWRGAKWIKWKYLPHDIGLWNFRTAGFRRVITNTFRGKSGHYENQDSK